MELTKQFTDDQYANALESWSWLDLSGKAPRFTSLFGDVFLQDRHDAWWFLSTITGELTPQWPHGAALAADLDTESGQDEFLLGPLAMAAFHRRGLTLNPDEVYTYVPPPVLTGSFDVDHIQVYTFPVALTVTGQLHHQLHTPPAA